MKNHNDNDDRTFIITFPTSGDTCRLALVSPSNATVNQKVYCCAECTHTHTRDNRKRRSIEKKKR